MEKAPDIVLFRNIKRRVANNHLPKRSEQED